MKRAVIALVTCVLTMVLAACQQPVPTLTYVGVSRTGDVERDLSLTFERRGDRLTGEYTVDAARGNFAGTASGTTVTAQLTPSPTCTYQFEGTLTDTALIGEFEVAGCPGGEGGTWELEHK